MINKMKERRKWNNKNNEGGRNYIDRLTKNYEEKQIKQELLIGIESVMNWKIGKPKQGLI